MSDKNKIDWTGERDLYVTGDESVVAVAKRLGVARNTVTSHANDIEQNGGRTWAQWREEFRAEVSGRTTEIVKRIKVEAAATVSMQHATLLAELAAQSREAVKDALALCDPKDKIKLALAIIATERRIHGLDRTAVQVEVTGRDGKPIEHDLTLEVDLGDDVRDRAQRSLETLFGKVTGSE